MILYVVVEVTSERKCVLWFLDAGHIELMKLLLNKVVDIESESDACTPLVWAAGHGQQDAVKLLLEHNAKVVGGLCVLTMNLLILAFSYSVQYPFVVILLINQRCKLFSTM
jgi:ankyrin repeat protein